MEPKSSAEQLPTPEQTPEAAALPASSPEAAPSMEAPVSKEGQQQDKGLPLPPVVDPVAQPQVAATTPQPQPPQDNSAAPAAQIPAEDVDVIEKAWVAKAKAIVSQTAQDPHQQEKEVGHLQADYMKQRYDKDVKKAS